MLASLDGFVFPPTWRDLRGDDVEDRKLARALADELRRELTFGHVLHRARCEVLAAALPGDDIVVSVDGNKAAIVHLTWTRRWHEKPPRPSTQLFESRDNLVAAIERLHPSDDYE
jgi:hypothetical protein